VIALRSDAAPCRTSMSRCPDVVEKLVNGGLVKAEEVGQITVERGKEGPAAPVGTCRSRTEGAQRVVVQRCHAKTQRRKELRRKGAYDRE